MVKEPFNRNYWAAFTARKEGTTKAAVLRRWDSITDHSLVKGNIVHGYAEDSVDESTGILKTYIGTSNAPYYNSTNPIWGYEVNLHILKNTAIVRLYPELFALIAKYVGLGFKLYSEKRIYSSTHLVAGTIDLLLVKDDTFIIVDWKTNKDELKFKSGYYKKVNGIKTNIWIDKDDRLLTPVSHLPDCKGMIYTLQLSLYAHIAELWGFKCLGLILCHLKSVMVAGEIKRVDYLSYNIKYLKKEANDILCYNAPVLSGKAPQRDKSKTLNLGI